ncbi:MAG: ArgR family transcriptional regulator [Buchananella hordeovulneris]|nr:ArgR family transcriptional regulator [Buchananella hordeovulneris]
MTTTARSRTGRHAAIMRLIETEDISSQEQLREQLAALGINATQATLSRDLVDLGAMKVRTADGVSAYRLPTEGVTGTHGRAVPQLGEAADSRLARWCSDLLAEARVALNQVVLHTPAGAAQLLAAALDRGVIPEVLGCVAGDDTVLVICSGQREAEELCAYLLRLAGRSESNLSTQVSPAVGGGAGEA